MWFIEAAQKTKANKTAIWRLWTDVENWHVWDLDVEHAKLNGLFTAGSGGYLKPKGGPKAQFVIDSCVELSSFTNLTKLPFCVMNFSHKMQERPDGLYVIHRVEMSGPLTFLFSKLLGKNIAKGLPHAVASLVAKAEALGGIEAV